MIKTWPHQGAAANRRAAGQSSGSGNLSAAPLCRKVLSSLSPFAWRRTERSGADRSGACEDHGPAQEFRRFIEPNHETWP